MNKHLQFLHFILICKSFVKIYWENSVYSSLIKHFSRIWISSPSLFLYEHGVKYFHEEHVFKNHDEVCQHYFLKINRRWGFLKSIDLIERFECLYSFWDGKNENSLKMISKLFEKSQRICQFLRIYILF